jgi:DNA-binding response OmpR family regulator
MDTNRKHSWSEGPSVRPTALRLGEDFKPGSMLPLAPPRVSCGSLEIDRTARRATLAGGVLRLTAREFAVLLFFVDRFNRVVRPSELLANVWSLSDANGSNIVSVYVRRLRRKFGAHAGMFETIRGLGYSLRPESRN